jgi:hypothetical protein
MVMDGESPRENATLAALVDQVVDAAEAAAKETGL